jgi:hypothetical protein
VVKFVHFILRQVSNLRYTGRFGGGEGYIPVRQGVFVANTCIHYSSGTPVCDLPVTCGGIILEKLYVDEQVHAQNSEPLWYLILTGVCFMY